MLPAKVPVTKEGYPFIFISTTTALLAALYGYYFLSLFTWLITLFIIFFFRDPERVIPTDPGAVVAPADGRVILVEKVKDDRFLHDKAIKVSIFMSIFNVHVNRIPYNSIVEDIQYQPGQFFPADQVKASFENENNALFLRIDEDQRMAVVQIAGILARRIVCWAENGDKVQKGQRFGMIRFGSRLDIYLPQRTQLEVSVGQRTFAGQTVLGYLT